jgi:hypothetical protein
VGVVDRRATPPPPPDREHDLLLEPAFNPMLGRIRILAEIGLSSMMVLHDFLSKHITPLHDRSRPVWLYTGVNDAMRLEHGDMLNLDFVYATLGAPAGVSFQALIESCKGRHR